MKNKQVLIKKVKIIHSYTDILYLEKINYLKFNYLKFNYLKFNYLKFNLKMFDYKLNHPMY